MKPKSYLWPVMRQLGWYRGLRAWLRCGLVGHQYEPLAGSQQVTEQHWLGPVGVSRGVVKLRCGRCEQVRLIRLEVVAFPTGDVHVRSPDLRVTFIAKNQTNLL